jgi:HEAT repeat protein
MLLQEVPFKCDLGGAPQAEPAHTAEDLKRQLIDGAPWESKRAARRLVELGSEAVPHLCEALAVGTAGVRWVAADALVHFADPRAEWVLCRALADPEATVQVRAIAALARINSPSAADALCGTLRDEDGSVREAAVIALGDLGFPDALESLLPLISDVDPAVRAARCSSSAMRR